MDQFDREEANIEDSYDRGEIDAKQRDHELRELGRDYRAYADEEARRAYDDRMREITGGW